MAKTSSASLVRPDSGELATSMCCTIPCWRNATTFMQQWAHDCEHQIFQHARQTGDCKIRNRCRGRAQRLQPVRQQLATPTCRASREGEVQATCSMIGIRQPITVVSSASTTTKLEPCGSSFKESVIIVAIFDSFLLHFRQFEAWHLKERSHSLKMKYAGSLEAIYMDLRSDPKPSVSHIWILPMWTIWMSFFEGHLVPGPFSRLMRCMTTLGWSIEDPPFVRDHEGHRHNFKFIDNKSVRFLLEAAWLQHVAATWPARSTTRPCVDFMDLMDI